MRETTYIHMVGSLGRHNLMAVYTLILVAGSGDRLGAFQVVAADDEAAMALMADHRGRHPEAKRIAIWDGGTRRVYPPPEVRRI